MGERYQRLDLLGQGSFGRVYRARDRLTGNLVAIKEFIKQPGRGFGFLREMGALFELVHPSIVACHSCFVEAGTWHVVYEYLAGGTLRSALEQRVDGRSSAELVRVLRCAMEGLSYAHQRKLIHRDFKPENVLLGGPGQPLAKVADFGLATFETSVETKRGLGSPAYMAPEQFYDQYDGRVDVYAAGVILFEILVGHRPFYGSPAQIMRAHLETVPEIPAWLPSELEKVLRQALAKSPADRFATVRAFADALDQAMKHEGDLLDQHGWPLQVDEVLEIVSTPERVIVRTPTATLVLDGRGRLVESSSPASVVLAAGGHHLKRSGGGDTTVFGPNGRRRIPGASNSSALALSSDGEVALVEDGGLFTVSLGGIQEVAPLRSGVFAAAYAADTLYWVERRAGSVELRSLGLTVALPNDVCGLSGHPRRPQLVARLEGDPPKLLLLEGGELRGSVTTPCSQLSTTDENFVSFTEDGRVVTINVATGRVAHTHWDEPVVALGACPGRIAWATRGGRVVSIP